MEAFAILAWLKELDEGGGIVIAVVLGGLGWMAKSLISWAAWMYGVKLREMELLVALHAEIKTNKQSEELLTNEAHVERMISEIESHARAGTPLKFFAPSSYGNLVFDEIKSDVSKLPKGCIERITEYYNLSLQFSILHRSLQSEEFAGLSPGRQERVVRQIPDRARGVVEAADKAIDQIDRERGIFGAKTVFLCVVIGSLAIAMLVKLALPLRV